MASADRGGPGWPGRGDHDHRRGIRQDPVHVGRSHLYAARHFASAGEHGHHRAGRAQSGPAGRLVPGQRARRAGRAGAVGVRVHGRGGVQSGDHGGTHPRRPWGLVGGGGVGVSGTGQGMAVGRRRSRRHRAARRRDRRGPRECVAGGVDRSTGMDFSVVELSDEDEAFRDEARDFLAAHMTEEVRRRDRETGDNFDEALHLKFGAAGYLEREWKPESDGGFTRVRRRIWELEKRRVRVPWVTWGTTAMVPRSVARFGSAKLQSEVMPKVFSGEVRLCLGYTEPEGGSDIATCKTRAVRDGDNWIINGFKS